MSADFNPTPHFSNTPSEIAPPFFFTQIKHEDMASISSAYPGKDWVNQQLRVNLALSVYPLTEHEMRHHLGCVNPEVTMRRIAKKQELSTQSFRVRNLDSEWHDVRVYFLRTGLHIQWEAVGREFTPEEMRQAKEAAQQTELAIRAAKGEGKA